MAFISSDLVRCTNVRENVTDPGHFREVWVTAVQEGWVEARLPGEKAEAEGVPALILEEGEEVYRSDKEE